MYHTLKISKRFDKPLDQIKSLRQVYSFIVRYLMDENRCCYFFCLLTTKYNFRIFLWCFKKNLESINKYIMNPKILYSLATYWIFNHKILIMKYNSKRWQKHLLVLMALLSLSFSYACGAHVLKRIDPCLILMWKL